MIRWTDARGQEGRGGLWRVEGVGRWGVRRRGGKGGGRKDRARHGEGECAKRQEAGLTMERVRDSNRGYNVKVKGGLG